VLGAFDPIPEIADICSKYKIWLHVDAAWGGGALVSKKHKHLLEGIERYVHPQLQIPSYNRLHYLCS
jgi:glutamate decarboxylase